MPHLKPQVRLWAGAQRQQLSAVRSALNDGADVNRCNDQGWNALLWSTSGHGVHGVGVTALVHLLLNAGAEVNHPGPTGPALSVAVRNYQPLSVVQVLLNAGADPNARDHQGHRPLFTCLSEGQARSSSSQWAVDRLLIRTTTARALIAAGALSTGLNEQGQDALSVAIEHDYVEKAFIARWQIGDEQRALNTIARAAMDAATPISPLEEPSFPRRRL